MLVAMSGGVDSSVAAALLVEAGREVVGATMKLFCHGDGEVAEGVAGAVVGDGTAGEVQRAP